MIRAHIFQRCSSLTAIFLTVAIAACGGSNGNNGPDAGSSSAPTVSSTSPDNAATGVALNSRFEVTFSEAMDPASISAATFTLAAPGGAAVAGTVAYVGVTALFKPGAALAANTVYTATVSAGATSAAGTALASSYSWQVTTGATADSTAPTVSSTSPANAATGISLDGNVAVTFSKPIDPTTVSAATFTLKHGTTAVAGAVTVAGVTAVFNPTQALAASSSYTASISAAQDLQGNALAASYAWTFTTGATADTTPPVASSTVPADAATSVATNSAIAVTFSKPMAPTTVTNTTFTLSTAGGAAVSGTVTYAGLTALFRPATALTINTKFTATVTTGAKDLAGIGLAANHAWSFTTGAVADTTPPTVASTDPLPAATGVLTTAFIKATFSEPMAPQSVSSSTFTLTGPGGGAIPGSVVFDSPTRVATFQVATSLAANSTYQARIKGGAGGVTDLAGNALLADDSWSFTTGSHVGLAPVLLGSSANYAILAQTAISTVPASAVTGDIAISPAAASYLTGFSLTAATGYATSTQVVGKVYAADQAPPTPSNLTTAVSDMHTGYTDAAGRPTPDFLELDTGAIGGLNLTPGLYKWTSTVTIASDVTLTGSATDVWIFQISGDLAMSPGKKVFLSGGALAKNVFWQVAGAVSLGTTSHFEGIILSQTAITFATGTSMNGRALAQTAVALDTTTLTRPAP